MLRVLRLYLKVAIFQPELRECAPRTMFVLKSCDFLAGLAGAEEDACAWYLGHHGVRGLFAAVFWRGEYLAVSARGAFAGRGCEHGMACG